MKHIISHDFAMDILESISGLMVIDESEKICFVSQSSARTLGYTRDEMIGLPVQEVISNSELPRVLKENEPDWGIYFRVEGPGMTVDSICNRVPIRRGGKAEGKIVGSLSYSSVPPGQDEDEVIKELEHLRRQNSMLKAHLTQIYSVDPDMEEIWGNSQQIRDAKSIIRQVAGTAATVCTDQNLSRNDLHRDVTGCIRILPHIRKLDKRFSVHLLIQLHQYRSHLLTRDTGIGSIVNNSG